MRYLPHTEDEIRQMLDVIGVNSIADLFKCIPDKFVLDKKLKLPDALCERELMSKLTELANKNSHDQYTSFIGAGIYDHYAPVVIDHILKRSEFYTAYTPYQPEVSQGTLQAIFEYQTLISLLLEIDVTNASMYDGATGCAEAVLMARRIARKKQKVLIAKNIHPEFRRVTETYMVNFPDAIIEVAFDEKTGRVDVEDLAEKLDGDTACLVVGHPNYFGVLEDIESLSAQVHEAGALLITTFSEPLAYGLVKGPGALGADIIAGEGQSFLGAMNFGGPSVGIFSTRQKYVRQMPGRLCGMTTDAEGRRGFVLTLSTREQHIRREKATSNICSNQGLCALSAAVFLSVTGKEGLRKLAHYNLANAEYLKGKIKKLDGFSLPFDSPTFNEFVISCNKIPADEVLSQLKAKGILAGIGLSTDFDTLSNHLLINVTEKHDKKMLDSFIEALSQAHVEGD